MSHMWRVPPEISLAASCCIWPPSERRTVAIRHGATQKVDWDRFAQVVRRQRVAGLVHDGLRCADVAIPAAIERLIAEMAIHDAHQSVKYAAESVRLQRLFDDAAIPILFVKGATLAKLVYSNIGIRHSKDIDFLVSLKDVPAALDRLAEAGYVRIQPPAELSDAGFLRWLAVRKACEFVHRENGVQIDLHWRLTDNPFLLTGDFSQSRQIVPLSNSLALRTLASDDLFSYLCAHGANAAWARLKWLADIGAIFEQQSSANIHRLYHVAELRGAGRGAAQAMLLCDRLLCTPIPRDLLKGFRENRMLCWLEGVGVDALAGGDTRAEIEDRPFGTTRITLSQYLLHGGRRFWAAELRIHFTNVDDVLLLQLPQALSFLYVLFRIPLWLWRRVRRRGRGPISTSAGDI